MELPFILDISLRLLFSGIIIFRNRSSSPVRLGWVVVVLLIPIAGMVLYLIFGEVWKRQGRLAEHKRIIQRARTELENRSESATHHRDTQSNPYLKVASAFEFQGGFPLRKGNQLRLFSDSRQTVQRIIDDIDQATHSCHLLFYIWLEDDAGSQIARALGRAQKRGVKCRVLVDSVGSSAFLDSALKVSMEQEGVEVLTSFPLTGFNIRIDHRNHRKLIVIDGEIGWTGSRNIADEEFRIKADFAPWVDVMARIQGSAVYDLQTIFIEDWLLEQPIPISSLQTPFPEVVTEGADVQVFATGPTWDIRTLRQIAVASLFCAQEELVITTPYFVPDEASITAFCALARSGVKTILIVPKRNDSRLVGAASRSFYQELLDAGVEIYEYCPGLLHAKTITIDRAFSILDTANFDRRSFELNYELSFTTTDREFTDELRTLQSEFIKESEKVEKRQWSQRGSVERFKENVARLFAPLL